MRIININHSIFIYQIKFNCALILKISITIISFLIIPFAGDNVDCWMEIQHGKGPWAPPVSGIVPLGSTLTLVIAINDYRGNELYNKIELS